MRKSRDEKTKSLIESLRSDIAFYERELRFPTEKIKDVRWLKRRLKQKRAMLNKLVGESDNG